MFVSVPLGFMEHLRLSGHEHFTALVLQACNIKQHPPWHSMIARWFSCSLQFQRHLIRNYNWTSERRTYDYLVQPLISSYNHASKNFLPLINLPVSGLFLFLIFNLSYHHYFTRCLRWQNNVMGCFFFCCLQTTGISILSWKMPQSLQKASKPS